MRQRVVEVLGLVRLGGGRGKGPLLLSRRLLRLYLDLWLKVNVDLCRWRRGKLLTEWSGGRGMLTRHLVLRTEMEIAVLIDILVQRLSLSI